MVVTKIEAVTKAKYKIYIEEQFAFVLYKGELSHYHIREGGEISSDTCRKIREEVLLKRAKLRALHLLNDMGRTESQLKTKLKQNGYPEDIAAEAMDYVKSFGYINDLNYAVSFIDSRKDRKSKRELQMQLRNKGVPEEVIEQAFGEAYEKEDPKKAIRKILLKRRYDPETATDAERQKTMAYLVRKGFAYEDVRHVIQGVIEVSEWNA